MKSYFFIPANKKEFLKKSRRIEANHIIIDLEDSIYNSNIEEGIDNIIELQLSSDYVIRLAFEPEWTSENLAYAERLVSYGFYRFLIPKIESKIHFDLIVDTLSRWTPRNELQIALLIENPKAILNLGEILNHPNVSSVGLGSHDYCNSMNMAHTFENLYWARMQILNTAKAFEKNVIDIASMNIKNKSEFSNECINAHALGYDAKFVIHPWQLAILNKLNYYSIKEITLALDIKKYIEKIGGEGNFTIAKIEGNVIEKPHLKRIKKILKTSGHESF